MRTLPVKITTNATSRLAKNVGLAQKKKSSSIHHKIPSSSSEVSGYQSCHLRPKHGEPFWSKTKSSHYQRREDMSDSC